MPESAACSKSIFLPTNYDKAKSDGYTEYLIVRKRYTEVRRNAQSSSRPQKIVPRGIITGLSRKAATRLRKKILGLEQLPNVWVDWTCPDDLFEPNQTDEQRRDIENAIFLRFARQMALRFPEVYGVSRREWKNRRTGSLKRQLIPHRHTLLVIPKIDQKVVKRIILRIQKLWIKSTGSNHPNALAVALHPKSYRVIQTERECTSYVSKYVSKDVQALGDGTSQGRCWNKIGNLRYDEIAEFLPLSCSESSFVRRALRRFVGCKVKFGKRAGRRIGLHELLKKYPCWLQIRSVTLLRLIDSVKPKLPGQKLVYEAF